MKVHEQKKQSLEKIPPTVSVSTKVIEVFKFLKEAEKRQKTPWEVWHSGVKMEE